MTIYKSIDNKASTQLKKAVEEPVPVQIEDSEETNDDFYKH